MKINHRESYKDFGKQFQVDNEYDGYLGSKELLSEIVHPFDLNLIKDKTIAEIGVGSGRISENLLKYEPFKLIAIEPSDAIEVAKKNIKSKKVEFHKIKAQDINLVNKFDYVFSLGVIHHIPEYKKALRKIQKSLNKNGKFIIWVYGKEGNEIYLFIFDNLRRITILLPDGILRLLSKILAWLTILYGFLCKYFKLPMRKYFLDFFNKQSFKEKYYTIFDQLNPSFSKYFTKEEIQNELNHEGFIVENYTHRLKYSHLLICSKKI